MMMTTIMRMMMTVKMIMMMRIMTMVIMGWPSFFFQGRKANAWKQICQICATLNLINGREDTFEGKIKLSFMKVRKMASEFEFCFI